MKKISALIIFLLASLFSFLLPPSISATWTKYAGNPILEPGAAGTWDDQGVFAPSVMLQDGIYKMWYAGYGGSPGPVGRIGYATSTDGLHWTKNANPVLGPSDSWEIDLGQPIVIFDETENNYKMWFTSTGKGTTSDIWRIGSATSPDGLVWLRDPGFVIMGTPGEWDSRGTAAPSVLKIDGIDGIYKMWYGGLKNGGIPQLGYATSQYGKVWEKYSENPIMAPSASEPAVVGDPHVIKELDNYTMFYHAYQPPSTMNMATSLDGINWVRSSSNPIFSLSTSGSFDNSQIAAPSVIKQNNIYRMWYSATGIGSPYWRIGYASTEEAAPPTPTPTQTPTSTPTPTTTPSPTATPTPVGPRKVVFLPGLGSSWNADAILNCKADGYEGNWTLAPFAADAYMPLLSALGENGKPFYYDWRRDVRSQTLILQNFINSLTSGGKKVNLVGHSLGGLVGRAYLENRGSDSKLEKLLTVGSPHQGAPQAYPGWAAGEVWEENFINKIAATILLKRCAAKRENPRETLQRIAPSIQNLLPTFNYLRDAKTKVLKPVSQMTTQNNWLPTDFNFYNVSVGTLSGTGFSTLKAIKVSERNKNDIRLGNWVDGKPIGKETVKEGDGTVLLSSAQLPGANNQIINQTHGGLVSSDEGIAKILNFLGMGETGLMTLKTMHTEPQVEPQSALVIIGYPSGFWVMDPRGKLIKSQEGMISINNPGKGHYRFGLIPKSEKTLFIVAQFLKDGRTLWKEYNFKNRLPKFGKINFNPGHPQEDALQFIF